MQCPKCNLEISEESKFCPNCGININEYNASLRAECPKCNKEIEKGTKFCKYCGVNIEEFKSNLEKTHIQENHDNYMNTWNLVRNIVVASIFVFIFIMWVIYKIDNISQQSYQPKDTYTPPQATIEVVNDRMVNIGYGLQEIQGVVKNTSNITCYNPDVEIYTFDSSGNRVGEHPIPILNSLGAGESYKFTVHDMGATRYEVRSCRCGYNQVNNISKTEQFADNQFTNKFVNYFRGKNATTFPEFLASSGISPKQFYDTFSNLEKNKDLFGNMNDLLRLEAQRQLGKELGSKVELRKGELVLNFNGNFLTLDDIERQLGTVIGLSNNVPKKFFKGKYGAIGEDEYDNFIKSGIK